jgi:hypothetical protein
MPKLSGQLVTRAEGDVPSFEGCRIEVVFGDRAGGRDRPSAISDEAGRFTLEWPDDQDIGDTVGFVVSSPAGRVIGKTEIPTSDLEDAIKIEVEGLEADPPEPLPPEPPPPGPPMTSNVRGQTTVEAAFQFNSAVRNVLTENLKPLRAEAEAIATRVDTAFATFAPTALSEDELRVRNFVEPGTDPSEVLGGIIKDRTRAIGSEDTSHTLTLRDSDDLKNLMTEAPGGAGDRHIDLHELIGFINGKLSSGSVGTEALFSQCEAEVEAEARVVALETPPAAGNGNGAPGGNGAGPGSLDADQLVKDSVNVQMHSATAPEARLEYGSMPLIPNTANQDGVQSGILQTFDLRPGASDVTSYHDFHTLQIAFPHVWSRIFDGQLESLGRELYHEYVKLKDFSGSEGDDLEVSTIGDLRALMDEVRKLSQVVQTDIPRDLRGGSGASQGRTQGSDDFREGVKDFVYVATGGVAWLLDAALAEFGKLFQKPIIHWEEFPGPWPPRGDKIYVSYDAAPAGTAEVALKTDSNSHLKSIEFQPWDDGKRTFVHAKPPLSISNAGQIELVTMTISPSLLDRGVLEFDSEESSAADIRGRYVLGDLASKLSDGTRVTFYWTDG